MRRSRARRQPQALAAPVMLPDGGDARGDIAIRSCSRLYLVFQHGYAATGGVSGALSELACADNVRSRRESCGKFENANNGKWIMTGVEAGETPSRTGMCRKGARGCLAAGKRPNREGEEGVERSMAGKIPDERPTTIYHHREIRAQTYLPQRCVRSVTRSRRVLLSNKTEVRSGRVDRE